jgi:hypothetical protein
VLNNYYNIIYINDNNDNIVDNGVVKDMKKKNLFTITINKGYKNFYVLGNLDIVINAKDVIVNTLNNVV